MLNRSASLTMSTSILKALPGKLDIKRHSPSIFYLSNLNGFAQYIPETATAELFTIKTLINKVF